MNSNISDLMFLLETLQQKHTNVAVRRS